MNTVKELKRGQEERNNCAQNENANSLNIEHNSNISRESLENLLNGIKKMNEIYIDPRD